MTNDVSIKKLILVPALITLAVTLLRLTGELMHWSKALFNPAAGGGGSDGVRGPRCAVAASAAGDADLPVGEDQDQGVVAVRHAGVQLVDQRPVANSKAPKGSEVDVVMGYGSTC